MTTMNCERARRGLWPPERPRLCGERVLEARRHVDDCAACRDYFAQDRALLDLYDRLRRKRAPRGVRENVFDALARERAGALTEVADGLPAVLRRGRRALGWAAAVVVTAGLVAVGWMGSSSVAGGSDEGAAAVAGGPVAAPAAVEGGAVFVEDYLRRAVAEDHIVSSDPEEVSGFLTRELGTPVAPLNLDGLEVEKAEICLLEGRRGAMVVYRREGRTISHYMIPRLDAEVRAPAPSPRLERALHAEGMPSVVTWADGMLEQALVGPVTADELMWLARASEDDW